MRNTYTATGLPVQAIRRLNHLVEQADYSADDRRKAAQTGAALPDGSFPIYTQVDVDKAWKLRNSGNRDQAAVVAHIRKRVKQLGLTMPSAANPDPDHDGD